MQIEVDDDARRLRRVGGSNRDFLFFRQMRYPAQA